MTPRLTIQIPTFRNPEQLKDTLLSLLVHTEFPYVIKVINNDQSREAVDEVVRAVGGYDL